MWSICQCHPLMVDMYESQSFREQTVQLIVHMFNNDEEKKFYNVGTWDSTTTTISSYLAVMQMAQSR